MAVCGWKPLTGLHSGDQAMTTDPELVMGADGCRPSTCVLGGNMCTPDFCAERHG